MRLEMSTSMWQRPIEALSNEGVKELHRLQAENIKLRELVQDVMPIVCDGCHERLCEMPEEEHPFVTCSLADRMRELGIEVDA